MERSVLFEYIILRIFHVGVRETKRRTTQGSGEFVFVHRYGLQGLHDVSEEQILQQAPVVFHGRPGQSNHQLMAAQPLVKAKP